MAYGMRPTNHGGYNYATGGFQEFVIDANGTSTRISNGDLVKLAAPNAGTTPVTGGLEVQGSVPEPGILTVGAGTAGLKPANPVLGVFVGCRYVDGNGTPTWNNYWPGFAEAAVSEAFGFVVTDPNAVFKIQSTGTWSNAIPGIVVDIAIAAGTTITGLSGNNVANYTANADGALRIIDVIRDGSNETSATPDILVKWSSPTVLYSGYQSPPGT